MEFGPANGESGCELLDQMKHSEESDENLDAVNMHYSVPYHPSIN